MKDYQTQTRLQPLTEATLAQENLHYANSAGISTNNRQQGFIPAFLDTETGKVYRSRFPNGRPAPVHILSGLPGELVEPDPASNGQRTIKNSVVSGFVRDNSFYSRKEAANAAALEQTH